MTGDADPELEKLQQRFPVGSLVRAGTGLIDRGVHEVIGYDRMRQPFRAAVLVLRTPEGDTARGTPDMWRIDAS